MNVFIGSDHAGFELKESLRKALGEIGYRVIDCGAFAYHPEDDYPFFISKVARAVSEAEAVRDSEENLPHIVAGERGAESVTRGIVIGGSGQGEAIVANKFPHVRAALCYGGESAGKIVELSREHNDANVLSLGARFISEDQALELVIKWLNAPFSGDSRHVRRIHEIEEIKHRPLYE
ncbi:MAG TPA: RpiB/LacA/LacB family sugar-phosphate isomerase [Candidatus Paceibacterota bacterium]